MLRNIVDPTWRAMLDAIIAYSKHTPLGKLPVEAWLR